MREDGHGEASAFLYLGIERVPEFCPMLLKGHEKVVPIFGLQPIVSIFGRCEAIELLHNFEGILVYKLHFHVTMVPADNVPYHVDAQFGFLICRASAK